VIHQYDEQENLRSRNQNLDLGSNYNTNLSVGQINQSVFKNTPEHVHQINADTDKRTTCFEIIMKIIRISQQLIELGYKKGEIVDILLFDEAKKFLKFWKRNFLLFEFCKNINFHV
jgi:hypothetical protein